MHVMKWDALLSEERFFWPRDLSEDRRPEIENKSWVFQQDAARISSSSAFRRLQAKTQVLPFPKTDYPRSRLTHTIEVSNIGRRIALNISRAIIDSNLFEGSNDPTKVSDFISGFVEVTAAACLAHDIGNPPFGHAGEDAIKLWFTERLSRGAEFKNLKKCAKQQLLDFTRFDGNAQGHRILTCLQGWGSEGGLQLSLAVLGAFSKYPRTSNYAAKDKFCVMEKHKTQADFIFSKIGLKRIKYDDKTGGFEYARHPLAFIVEAADDIAYITADLEDAVRGGVIEFSKAESLLKSIASRSDYPKSQSERMKRYGGIGVDSINSKLRYLRTHAITEMVREAEAVFMKNYNQIMSGEYLEKRDSTKNIIQYGELLKDSSLSDKVKDIKSISSKEIHDARGKIENEVAGKNIIFGLLNMFGEIFDKLIERRSFDKLAEVDRKLALIFPWDNYYNTSSLDFHIQNVTVEDLLYMLTDFISGMTDRYASNMFRQLSGHQQPFASW